LGWVLESVDALDEDLAAGGKKEGGHDLEEGGFSCAVWAKESHEFSRLHLEVNPLEGGNFPAAAWAKEPNPFAHHVSFGYVVELNHGFSSTMSYGE
jgi:hypothetical protein